MAIDPTTTGQPSGWGLSALGAPSVSTAPLAPRQMQLSPEQIAALRQQAVALQEPPKQNIQHWTQGLAELVRAMQGNREADFAREQEKQGRQQGADAISQIYAPYLSQGGGASPPAAGAPPAASPAAAQDTAPPASAPPTVTAGASAPRGIRNNNPLNIEDGAFAQSQPGYAGSDGRFAKFASPDHGVGAANSLLDIYGQKHGLNTIAGIVGRWAPASDNNNTAAYAADVAKQLGIGPNDPIPPSMRPALIAAMARHENGVPFPVPSAPTQASAAPAARPTGLLAPIPAAAPPAVTAPPPVPANQAAATPPIRVASAGNTLPPGILPTQGGGGQVPTQRSVFDTGAPPVAQSPISPLVNAIAGRPPAPPPAPALPPPAGAPPDFATQAAMLAAKNGEPSVPLQQQQPTDFSRAAAAMAALKPAVPLSPDQASAIMPGAPPSSPPPAAATAAAPPSPVPVPTPRPEVPLPRGSAIPGAVGPTSVGGTHLMPPIDVPPRAYSPTTPPANPTMVNAIAGGDAAAGGAPNQPAPIRVAQNGPLTTAPPAPGAPPAAGGPAGLPSPLTPATGQITQDQLTRVLANPWVPEQAKAAMLQMIQQRGQPQSMAVEGGTLMYNAAGQKVFIPEPKFGTVEIGGAKIPTVSHFDPTTQRWNTTTLAPGGGVQTTPGPDGHPAQSQGGTPQPDLSTIGGIQAAEAAQAGAKKGAEAGAEANAKYYDAVHRGLAGSGMIAAQQKQNIDALRQIASSPDFISGTFADSGLAMQRLASAVGINPAGAAPRELFNQLAAKVLADQFSGLKSMASETGESGARIFKPMLDIEEKANITSGDSGPGLLAKLNLLDQSGNLMMRYADLADDYIKEHGHLDSGFDKTIRKEIAGSRISNIVPPSESSQPSMSDVEAELRKRGKLPPAGPAAAPVSR